MSLHYICAVVYHVAGISVSDGHLFGFTARRDD